MKELFSMPQVGVSHIQNNVPNMQISVLIQAFVILSVVLRTDPFRKEINEEWDRIAPITFYYGSEPALSNQISEISKEIRQFYFGNAEINLETEQNLTNLYTDALFLKGIQDTALLMAKHTPVYTGLFTQLRKDFSFTWFFGIKEILGMWELCWKKDLLALNHEWNIYLFNQGISHGDDLAFLFDGEEPYRQVNPAFVMKDVVDEDDVKTSKALVKMITSFAASGLVSNEQPREII